MEALPGELRRWRAGRREIAARKPHSAAARRRARSPARAGTSPHRSALKSPARACEPRGGFAAASPARPNKRRFTETIRKRLAESVVRQLKGSAAGRHNMTQQDGRHSLRPPSSTSREEAGTGERGPESSALNGSRRSSPPLSICQAAPRPREGALEPGHSRRGVSRPPWPAGRPSEDVVDLASYRAPRDAIARVVGADCSRPTASGCWIIKRRARPK